MKLFIRNLSTDVSSDQLMEAFEEHGWVDSVEIIKHGETGESLGFAFVVMSTSYLAPKRPGCGTVLHAVIRASHHDTCRSDAQ